MITFSEFKKKEVLDISSGKNLGRATDILFVRHTGEIEKIITSGKHGGFLSCESLEIPFKSIIKIGDDAVLVDTSDLDFEQSVEALYNIAKRIGE